MKRLVLVVVLVQAWVAPAAMAADRSLHLAIGDPARRDHEVAVVLDGITDAAWGDTLTPAELAARLDGVQMVFVGESHTDMEFHRVQLKLIQELHQRGRQVLVGLEMYPVPEQPWLDRWHSQQELTEARFLAESHWYRNWGYNWNYYRDIFVYSRENGIRMFAINLPRTAVQTVRMKGFEALSPAERAMLPERIDLENAEHQQLFRAFFDSDDALHGNLPEPMFQSMFRAQCAWDAAMGWNALRALQAHGGKQAIMVVLIGGGHVAYGLGAERQVRLWFDGTIASVLPLPITDEVNHPPIQKVQASYANFVWGLPPVTDPIYPTVGLSMPEQKSGERFKVIQVGKGSPAEAAGLGAGDELVSIDGVAIQDKETINQLIAQKRWGDSAVYKVIREGQERTFTVELRRRPPEVPAPAAAAPVTPAPANEGSGK